MTSFEARTPRRLPLAVTVFEDLAAAILTGRITGTLPPERELAERFGVSRMLVRQGVHRLAEAGLVQLRQGGSTKVLDPNECGDLRVIELFYRFGAPAEAGWDELRAHVKEKQYTQGLSLLETFERNASIAAREQLVQIASRVTEPDRYDRELWEAIAQGGGNRILIAEVRWWYHVLADRPASAATPEQTRAFYIELARRLHVSEDAVGFYRSTLGAPRSAR